jgi:hypothetical protein
MGIQIYVSDCISACMHARARLLQGYAHTHIEKRGRSSVTKKMLNERDAQLDAEEYISLDVYIPAFSYVTSFCMLSNHLANATNPHSDLETICLISNLGSPAYVQALLPRGLQSMDTVSLCGSLSPLNQIHYTITKVFIRITFLDRLPKLCQ